MSTPEPGQPPNTANGRPYGPQGRIRYTRPIDRATPGDDTWFYLDDTLFYEEETPMSGPGSEWSGPGFEPLPDAAGEAPYDPEPAQPADPAGGSPYAPEPVRFADPGDEPVTGDSIRPYGEWSHEAAVPAEPAEPADYRLPRNPEPPTGWAGGGFDWAHPQGMTAPAEWPAYGAHTLQPGAEPGPYGPHRAGQRRPRRFAWRLVHVIIMLVMMTVGATVAEFPRIVTGGQPSSAAQSPAITRAQARQVVANYFVVDNEANQARSDALLARIEGGSAYPMDAGLFQVDRASNPSGSDIAPVGATHTVYYIPRQPASAAYPHWFAVQVTVAPLASPQDPDGTGYMVFSQASPGAAWKDVAEPGIVASGPAPQIAADAQGYATQVSGTGGLSTAPGAVSQLTAGALDAPGTAALKVPGSLADQQDEASLRSQFPAGTTVTDTHQAAAGPVFGLRAKDGGAIVFYTVTAQLDVVPPPGQMLQLDVPGFYSPAQALASADLRYVEQFAAYVPPAGRGGWQIVAAVSNIASQG